MFILVIPLEDLPELQVGFGFGLVDKDHVKKPTFLKVSQFCADALSPQPNFISQIFNFFCSL